jgi:rhodanese-related sulfurtransferase
VKVSESEDNGKTMKWPFQRQQPATEEEERETFRWISIDEAKQLMESGQAQIIDVREPWEYKAGHIPGARLVPLNSLLRQPRQFLTGDNIVFVCAVGQRSAVACEMAAALGFSHIYNIRCGMQRWIARGYPTGKLGVKASRYLDDALTLLTP